MALSRRLRFEVLRRDGYACRYCGAKAPDAVITVDHVIPVALGGGDDPGNLVAACKDCNAGKSSTRPDDPIVAEVDAAALLFAKAVEKAAAIRSAELTALDFVLEQFEARWSDFTVTMRDGSTRPVPKPDDWRTSIERFLASGLLPADLGRFVDTAMRADVPSGRVFRYFCGICWNEIGQRQELARRLIEDGQA